MGPLYFADLQFAMGPPYSARMIKSGTVSALHHKSTQIKGHNIHLNMPNWPIHQPDTTRQTAGDEPAS